jgi:hypothetical protein
MLSLTIEKMSEQLVHLHLLLGIKHKQSHIFVVILFVRILNVSLHCSSRLDA